MPPVNTTNRTSQAQPSQNANRVQAKSKKDKIIRDEPVLVTMLLSPFRATEKTYSYLSSIKGSNIIGTLMSLYCAGLSVEAVFVGTPVAIGKASGLEYTEALQRERRFIPKPYVDDGAELGRLNPIPTIQRAVLERYFQWLPAWIRSGAKSDYSTVWDSTGVLVLSVVVALTIQHWEGKIWRKKSYSKTQREFNEVNRLKKVTADPDAIAVATYKAGQHNAQGTGGVVGTFVAVTMLYGLEIAAFVGSFAGAGSFVVNAVYGFLTIAGFEVFEKMREASDQAHIDGD